MLWPGLAPWLIGGKKVKDRSKKQEERDLGDKEREREKEDVAGSAERTSLTDARMKDHSSLICEEKRARGGGEVLQLAYHCDRQIERLTSFYKITRSIT